MNTPTATQPTRFRALDGLRGLAALLVVLLHVEWQNHITGTRFIKNGYLAVDLFFILSGFVIAANYATRITDIASSLRFMGLRFFRLYPLHIVVLAAFVGMELCKVAAQFALGSVWVRQPFSGGESLSALIATVFLLNGAGFVKEWGWNGPSWSISCEFFVYFLFAIAAAFGVFRSRWAIACGVIITTMVYLCIAYFRRTLDLTLDLGIVRCIAGFFCGNIIFLCSESRSFRSLLGNHRFELSTALIVIVSMAALSGPMVVVLIPLFAFLVASLISEEGHVGRLLTSKPIQSLGRISFSIYMIHEFLVICFAMVLKRVARPSFDPAIGRVVAATNLWLGDALVVLFVLSVVIIAFFANRFVEEPGRIFGRELLLGEAEARRSPGMATRPKVIQEVQSECP